MAFHPDVIAAFESGNIGRRLFLVKLDFDSGSRFFTTAPEEKLYNGDTYLPLGEFGSVGAVKETDKIEPADYSITIGAVDSDILALVLGEPTINRKCTVYQGLMNEDQTIIGDYWIYFEGLMQPPSINDGKTPLITIPIKDILADWDRNIETRYTDAEQQRQHEGDHCLEYVSSIAGKVVIWPTEKWFKDNN